MKVLSSLLFAAVIAAPVAARADATSMVTDAVHHYQDLHAFKGAVVVVVDHGYYWWFNYGWRSNTDGISISTPIYLGANTRGFVGASLAMSGKEATELHTVATSLSANALPYHATLADLADYTSGLPEDAPSVPTQRSALYGQLASCSGWVKPCVLPHTVTRNSHMGYQVLGNMLAQLAGLATWPELDEAEVTGPLGMTRTCTRGDGCHPTFPTSHAHAFDFAGNEQPLPAFNDITEPDDGLWTTGQDMAIWLHYQLGQIAGTTPELVRLDAALPKLRTQIAGGFGYGWNFKTLTTVTLPDGTHPKIRTKDGHETGLGTYIAIDDKDQTAVFVFVNRDGSDPAVQDPIDALRADLGEPILAAFLQTAP